MSRPVELQVGDRLVREYANDSRQYRVIGWSPRGKVRLLREHEGTETSAWWLTTAHLPEHWRLYRDTEVTA